MFWLLGATDGHAKNFSISLQTRSRFRLIPLYDAVMSVPPAQRPS
jgi:serine/threonine-protein kinase HipA